MERPRVQARGAATQATAKVGRPHDGAGAGRVGVFSVLIAFLILR